jgi:hypothetical protein
MAGKLMADEQAEAVARENAIVARIELAPMLANGKPSAELIRAEREWAAEQQRQHELRHGRRTSVSQPSEAAGACPIITAPRRKARQRGAGRPRARRSSRSSSRSGDSGDGSSGSSDSDGDGPPPALAGRLLPGLSLDAVERLRARSAAAHHRACMRDALLRVEGGRA